MATLSPTDPRAQRIQKLLSERRTFLRTNNEEGEKNVLQTLLNELDSLRKNKIKAIPDKNISFDGKTTGKRNATTMTTTYLRNINRRLMTLEDPDKKTNSKILQDIKDERKARRAGEVNPSVGTLLMNPEEKALTTPLPSGDDNATFSDIKQILNTLDSKSSLMPTTINPATIAPPPPSLSALDRKKGNYKPMREYNQFMTRVKKLEIAPEDYLRNLDIDQLKALPPKVAEDPAFKPMIKERIKKLTKKQQAQERLLYEKELEAQKKIEASKQEFDEQHGTDNHEIAPSELSIRNIDHMNPIMMRQFQFTDPNNIPQIAKELQEKDTLRRATRIKVYDDEPKTINTAGEKLERGMKQRLRKPKVRFEPSNEQRQPLESFQVTNRGESGLDMGEMYELLGFRADGSRDEHTEATLRYIRDRY